MVGPKLINYKTLIIFSLPSIMSSLLEPMASIVDTAFIGRINTQWLGALAISSILLNSFTWIFNFLVHATTQSVSSANSGDNEILKEKIRISLIVAILVGLGSAVILYLFRYYLYKLAGASSELTDLIDKYFVLRIIGHPFTIFYLTVISVLRGLGKVNVSFFFVISTTFLNVILTWLFLYKWGYDLSGAAYGTVLANIIGAILSFALLLSNEKMKGLIGSIRSSSQHWFQFGKNSKDIFFRTASITFAFFISTRLASKLGIEHLAAHQILVQLWLLSSFFTDGVAITGNVLGAHYFAFGDKQKLREISQKLIHIGGAIGFIFTLVYFFLGKEIIQIFTTDHQVFLIALTVWPIIYLSQIISSIAFTYDGLMFGFGEFAYLRKHIFIGVFFFFLPMALSLYLWQSLWCIWSGLVALNVYRAGALFNRTKQVLA